MLDAGLRPLRQWNLQCLIMRNAFMKHSEISGLSISRRWRTGSTLTPSYIMGAWYQKRYKLQQSEGTQNTTVTPLPSVNFHGALGDETEGQNEVTDVPARTVSMSNFQSRSINIEHPNMESVWHVWDDLWYITKSGLWFLGQPSGCPSNNPSAIHLANTDQD